MIEKEQKWSHNHKVMSKKKCLFTFYQDVNIYPQHKHKPDWCHGYDDWKKKWNLVTISEKRSLQIAKSSVSNSQYKKLKIRQR